MKVDKWGENEKRQFSNRTAAAGSRRPGCFTQITLVMTWRPRPFNQKISLQPFQTGSVNFIYLRDPDARRLIMLMRRSPERLGFRSLLTEYGNGLPVYGIFENGHLNNALP